MKKVLFVSLLVFALLGCEKERCFECTATVTIMGQTGVSRSIYCGQMTKKEAEDMAMSMVSTADGIYYKVVCREQ
jgi:hypothetical protein